MPLKLLSIACCMLNILYAKAQDTVLVPTTGNGGIINSCYGVLMDDGGDSNYTNFSDGYIAIAPQWATEVNLYFDEFNFEQVFDHINIYDGPSPSFPLIGQYSGTSLQGQTIYSTGPYLCIQQFSDDILTFGGFKATWVCTLGNEDHVEQSTIIYPNPVTDKFYVEDKKNIGTHLKVINELGQLMYDDVLPATVDTRNWGTGIYFVLLFDAHQQQILSKKVIKE